VTAPTPGRIVHYCLTSADAAAFNRFGAANRMQEGDILPALIVRVWSDHTVNLRVFADGPAGADQWMTSRERGDQIEGVPVPGRWLWPERV
jgi:hypothetical protein